MMYDPKRDPEYDPIIMCRVFRCDNCDGAIYDGDDYYEIDGMWLCRSCAEDHFRECRRTAERIGA